MLDGAYDAALLAAAGVQLGLAPTRRMDRGRKPCPRAGQGRTRAQCRAADQETLRRWRRSMNQKARRGGGRAGVPPTPGGGCRRRSRIRTRENGYAQGPEWWTRRRRRRSRQRARSQAGRSRDGWPPGARPGAQSIMTVSRADSPERRGSQDAASKDGVLAWSGAGGGEAL